MNTNLRAIRPDFAAVRRRLVGAEQDFEALAGDMQATIDAYAKLHQGQAIQLALRGDRQETRVIVTVLGLMPIPDHWDRRIAHVLYDARSTLDHLVHELHVASTGERPRGRNAGALEFPICDKKAAWMNAIADTPKHISKLHGLDDRFVRIIHRHQPYRSRKTAMPRLRRFNDLDKHRRPNVVLFAVSKAQISAHSLGGCQVVGIDLLPAMRRQLRVGADLANVRINPIGAAAGQPCVGVGFEGAVYPALTRGVQIDDMIRKILLEVHSIVEACSAVA